MAHDHDAGIEQHDDHPTEDDFTSALTLRPRQPFLDWVREVEPEPGPGASGANDLAVVLTPELPHAADRDKWLAQHHEEVFACQLAPWTDDESRWPADRSLDGLRRWFDLEWAPIVDDLTALAVKPPVTCGPVSLSALRAEFASLPEGSGLFLDVQTGEMVSFSPEELDALEHDEPSRANLDAAAFAEVVRLFESETLVELPSPSEGVTRLVMESFAETLRVPAVRNRLLNALDAKKPVRRFLETIDASGLRKQWQAHHDEAVTDLIREALEYFGVPTVGDGEPRDGRRPRSLP
jgi:hypothetical protein